MSYSIAGVHIFSKNIYMPEWCNLEQGWKTFQKSRSHLKILDARRVTCSMYHTQNPKILGASVQNLVALATWRQGFVHPCSINLFSYCGFKSNGQLDVHGSMHRNINPIERTNKMRPCSRIYYSNVS